MPLKGKFNPRPATLATRKHRQFVQILSVANVDSENPIFFIILSFIYDLLFTSYISYKRDKYKK